MPPNLCGGGLSSVSPWRALEGLTRSQSGRGVVDIHIQRAAILGAGVGRDRGIILVVVMDVGSNYSGQKVIDVNASREAIIFGVGLAVLAVAMIEWNESRTAMGNLTLLLSGWGLWSWPTPSHTKKLPPPQFCRSKKHGD